MWHEILKRKPIDQKQNSELKKCLSAFDLTLLGIGAIIGTGIFVLTGKAAAEQAGPAIILSFIIAGFACTFAALAYAELASTLGGCGSAYSYSYIAFGEIVAWMIGWILLLEYSVSVAAVANGWSGYFIHVMNEIGWGIPTALTKSPQMGGIINLPALSIILVLMGLLIKGAKESAQLNTVMVFIKISVILLFIVLASQNIDPHNWDPFMPFGWLDFTENGGRVGVLAGSATIFFAYIGFDAVSTAVEEAKNPQRDAAIGILASLAICTVIYIIVSGLLTGIVPYQKFLGVDHPVAFALKEIGYSWASALVAVGVIAGLTTVMLVLYYGLTRIVLAMSRDGLISANLASIDPIRKTPVKIIVLTGIIMSISAGLVPLGKLAHIVNIGTLAAFVLVCLAVIVMRTRYPDLPRPYRVPYSPTIPILGIIFCVGLMLFLPLHTWLFFIAWLLVGVVVYFVYAKKHSYLR